MTQYVGLDVSLKGSGLSPPWPMLSRSRGPMPGSGLHRGASSREKWTTTATSRGVVIASCALLYEAAAVLLTRVRRESALRRWGLMLWKRLGFKRAATALARKMAVVLHAMWKSGTAFNPTLSAVTP